MLKTFRLGGIHPAENKLSANKKIETLELPAQVIIPLGQHIGAPAKPVVKKGDAVKVGTLIAEAGGFVSANIHSSVSGTVAKIDDALDATGNRRPAIYINVEGDEWEESIDRSETLVTEIKLDSKQIVERIKACGIVGLGGATFPTHVKLMPPPGSKAEVVIINAVECEPYLTSDHQLMLEKGEEILVGVNILCKAVDVKRAIIGIENNKKDAIELMTKLAAKYPNITVQPLKVQYPQGGEKQLIDACIRRQVPSGALPIATGAVVQNVGTAFAVYEAVQKNKPLFERIVTVTGKSLKSPSNFRARVGMPIMQLIEKAGGLPEDTGKVISGGPMMGKAMTQLDSSVVKGCSGILIMREDESRRGEMTDCIRCSKCLQACPMGLDPTRLMSLSQRGMFEEMEGERTMDCIECGSCSFICPAHRTLLDYIRLGKGKVGAIIRARAAANAPKK
jgi:electron transport complex protein RnfC